MHPEPIRIELRLSARELQIDWSDGHQSVYDLDYLRGYCPCAHCQGHGGRWEYHPSAGAELGAIEEVGNYAYNLVWGDRHQTGIYSFDLLRELCPCAECVRVMGARHPLRRMSAAQ